MSIFLFFLWNASNSAQHILPDRAAVPAIFVCFVFSSRASLILEAAGVQVFFLHVCIFCFCYMCTYICIQLCMEVRMHIYMNVYLYMYVFVF